jgi:hypothetical protein
MAMLYTILIMPLTKLFRFLFKPSSSPVANPNQTIEKRAGMSRETGAAIGVIIGFIIIFIFF